LGPNYNNFGYTLDGTTYGGGGPIGPSTLNGSSVPWVYCIDIPDEIGVGATYANNTVTTNGTAVYGTPSKNPWANGTNLVSVPNAGAIAWLLDKYANGATTALQQNGLQAALWKEIYGSRFVVTDPSVNAQMNTYLTGVGSDPVSNEFWLSPNGVGNTPIVQALVTSNGENIQITGAPEPSTMAIAGLGAVGFLAYGWKRRKSS
jgi:hypothetical protein